MSMIATGIRRYRNLVARGNALWERRGAWGSLWTPAPRNGRTPFGAGDLTEAGLNIVTALASAYLIGRIAFGLWSM